MVNKIYFFLFLILISACSKTEEQKLFKLLDPQESGINFENNLPFDEDFNVYKYRNFYNGGGVSIGDIDNDGLLDVYMTNNLGPNKLYKKSVGLKIALITLEKAPEFLEPPSYPLEGRPGILYLYDLLTGTFFASISRYPVS